MPPKRKRVDRSAADSGPSRPSPHRPGDTMLGQQSSYAESGRGGRGGRTTRRSERRDSAQHQRNSSASYSTAPPPVSPSTARPSSALSHAPAPATTAAPAPQPKQTAASASPAPSRRSYDIVTDDRVTRWTKGGKQEVTDHGIQARSDEDHIEVSTIFQELLFSVVDSRLDPHSAGTVVKDIVGPGQEDKTLALDPHSLFLDTVSVAMDLEPGLYRPEIRDFMMATGISPMLMRQILDPPFLQQLGLIRDTFVKIGIRQSTNLLYRQANYNLLREETEGYSKLTTELFTTCSTEPPSSDTVKATFEKVKALIGTFDLDVGRVLDVTLDVFAAVLVKQFRFFIKFLRISSWWPRSQIAHSTRVYTGGLPEWALPDFKHWMTTEEDDAVLAEERRKRDVLFWDRAREVHLDAFFELGGRQITLGDEQRLAKILQADDSEADEEQKWIKSTKTLPPPGNRVAAQLLGFKLRFYASEARDKDDILPANLLFLAALLIKVGFISLCDLWAHLWPPDENMAILKVAKLKELEEKERLNRPGGAMNALMMAGALPDDSPPVPGTSLRRELGAPKLDAEQKPDAENVEDKSKLPEPMEQKVQLLTHLLTIGAIPESLFILGRYEWLPQAYPDLLPLIHRIILHSIDSVYRESCPVRLDASADTVECPPKRLPELDQTGVPKGTVKLGQPQPKRTLRWPHADNPNHEGQAYRFYWDEWADNVPVCQTVDDFFTLCSTYMNISGVNIGTNAELLTKIASIGNKSLADNRSPENFARWQDLLRRLLVPALSLTGSNSSVVSAVWEMLRQYPTTVRYTIYAEWYEGQISRLEPMRKAFQRTRLETLSTMKRLSLTNLSQMARTLAKTAYASPGIVFKVALEQIEAYSNLIEAFVECAKYFTELGYDVLVWSLMSSLGGKQRSRTQETSVLLTSKWLQALSKFSGRVFKRYSIMNPTPVVQYVNDQLFSGNSTDLVILKELVTAMGGVVSDVDFTDAQLRAMTGGAVLRQQTLINLQDKRYDSTKSASRLMKALVDNKLAGRLLINIAQYRQSAIYRVPDQEAHIKFLATMVDDTHQMLVQYLELLRSNLKPDEFDTLVPDVIHLMKDFGLDVGLAFMIGRASLVYSTKSPLSITTKEDQIQGEKVQTVIDADGDIAMEAKATNGHESTELAAEDDVTTDKMLLDDRDAKEPTGESVSTSVTVNGRQSDPFLDTLQPIIDAIPALTPHDMWNQISPGFYVMFWSLQLGDVAVPESSYRAEHDRLRKQSAEVMKDRSDMSRQGMNKLNQKKRDLATKMSVIMDELKQHIELYQKTRFRLAKQARTWFPSTISRANATADVILEQCVLPRLLLSASDSEYCFKMVKCLHEIRAPNFKLMSLYDRLFNQNRLRSMIFACTVREAEHLGRFIKGILGDLSRWHADKTLYEKEALGQTKAGIPTSRNNPGFATEFDEEGKPKAFVEHDPFRDLLFRWHRNLNTALRSCLGGMEWMHIRNAITVLKTVIDYFPAITFMADKFLEQLKGITDREAASKTSDGEEGHRVDLSVAAQTACSELLKRKSQWVLVQAFRSNTSGESKDERQNPTTKTAVPSTSTATMLRATAAEFKPSRPLSATRNPSVPEVEDGEVKDGKDAKVLASSSAPTTAAIKESAPVKQSTDIRESQRNESRPSVSHTQDPRNESTSKPTTPKPAPAVPVPAATSRSELPKLPTPAHSLPSRPDVPFPERFSADKFNSNRYGQVRPDRRDQSLPRDGREPVEPREPHLRDVRDHRDQRDLRDGTDPRDSRDHRTPDGSTRQDRPRDFTGPDRRSHDGLSRVGGGRPSERDWPTRPEPRRSDYGPTPERDPRQPRDSRDRPLPTSTRPQDLRAPREAAPTNPSPVAAPQSLPQEPHMNPERARSLAGPDRPEPSLNDIRGHHSRSTRDEGRNQASPRVESPRRLEQNMSTMEPPDTRRDDRTSRSRHADYPPTTSRDGQEEPGPSHSRGDRNADRDGERAQERAPVDRKRDSAPFQGPSSTSDRSRPISQQDPNYGRLSHTPSAADSGSGPPSGPRGRGSRGAGRGGVSNAPPPRPDGRLPTTDAQRAPSPDRADRHVPTGPASSRPRRGPYETGNTNLSSPTSAVGPSTAGGVHPDRLRQMNITGMTAPSPPHQPPIGSGSANSVPVHPGRMAQMSTGTPAPGPVPQSRQNGPPHNTSDRPPVPTGPLPGSRMPSSSVPASNMGPDRLYPQQTPTGPAMNKDRRTSSKRPFSIQDIVHKNKNINDSDNSADVQGRGSFRGRGSRAGLPDSDAQVLTGSSPMNTPLSERHEPTRRDGPSDRPSAGAEANQAGRDSREPRGGGPNGDGYQNSREDHDRAGRREHRDRSDRSGRPSRRSSRERSPERDGKDPRDYRDRGGSRPGPPAGGAGGGNARDGERDGAPPRRSGREPAGSSRELLSAGGSGRDAGRESRHRADGPGGRASEEWGGVSGRGGRGTGGPRDGPRDGGPRDGGPRDNIPRDLGLRAADDRRDSRGDDRGRKRRSEEGTGSLGNDREKRQRR